jgi:hypothetical protein
MKNKNIEPTSSTHLSTIPLWNLNMETNIINPEMNQTNLSPEIIDKDEHFYNMKNIYLLIFCIFAFFILGYYLYYKSKTNLKRIKSINAESLALIAKFSNIKKLAYANFRNNYINLI